MKLSLRFRSQLLRWIQIFFCPAFFILILFACNAGKQTADMQDVSQLLSDPDAFANIDSLPLIPSKTSTVYRAKEGEWQYNLHSYLYRYDNKFWAMWSSGPVNESDRNRQYTIPHRPMVIIGKKQRLSPILLLLKTENPG